MKTNDMNPTREPFEHKPGSTEPTPRDRGTHVDSSGDHMKPSQHIGKDSARESSEGVIPQKYIDKGAEAYNRTEEMASQAYEKTSEVMHDTYHQASKYARNNPETTTLLAFGAGLAVGLLFGGTRRSSSSRYYAEPVVDALYDVAMGFLRR